MSQLSTVVSDGELIGRRIFDKKLTQLTSIDDVHPNTFFDTRLDDDISVDRLGNGSATKSTLKHLTALADASAREQATNFLGWIANHKKNIKQTSIIPDPLSIKLHDVDNPYHGLIDRAGARERVAAFHLSRSLLFMFQKDGQLVEPVR